MHDKNKVAVRESIQKLDQIISMIESNRSAYRQTRKTIEKAHATVDRHPRRALRYIKKAERLTIDESIVSARFDSLESMLSNNDLGKKREVASVVSRYKRLVAVGKIASSKKMVKKLESIVWKRDISPALSILVPETVLGKKNTVEMIVNNHTQSKITVRSIYCSSPDTEIILGALMRSIPPRGQETYTATVAPTAKGSIGLNVSVNYTMNMHDKTQRGAFRLMTER